MTTMTDNNDYIFEIEIKVRDYELDAEGIVNNANYLHYLEFTRHEFCEARGYSFDDMRRDGIVPVLRRAELDYLSPLRSGDTMKSRLNLERRGPRFIFRQSIVKADGTPVLNASITCVTIENGRPSRGDSLGRMFGL